MSNNNRYIKAIIILLLGLATLQSCRLNEQELEYNNGSWLTSLPSDRFVVLDTTNWIFRNQASNYYYFERLDNSQPVPAKGDYISYSNSIKTFFGQLTGFQQDGTVLGLEIEPVSLNTVFKFFAYRDTIRTLGNGYYQSVAEVATVVNDTLKISQAEIEVKEGIFTRGILSIENLTIYEIGDGEIFFYLSPAWQAGNTTRDAQLEWDQDLDIQGKMRYVANDRQEYADSMLIRHRMYSEIVEGFPVQILVEDWLIFDWHMPGAETFTFDFHLHGVSDYAARIGESGEWNIQSSSNFICDNITLDGWNRLVSGYVKLGFKTKITPVFGGSEGLQIVKDLELRVDANSEWPNWQMDGKIEHQNNFRSQPVVIEDFPELTYLSAKFSTSVLSLSGVLENQPPVADFIISPPNGFTDTNFKLNASSSTDVEDDRDELQVRWDINGDGFWDTPFSTNKISIQQFPNPGTYNIILEVMDTQGATSSQSKELIVHEPSSAPIATFSVSPESGKQAELFTFDASGCYDAEDPLSALEVRWDFQNDGLWDTHYSTTKAAVWIFGQPGDFVVKLEVRDTDGLTGSTTRLIRVTAGNVKPTAFYVVNPENGTTATTFSFDASGSSDTEDKVEDLLVRWDFENDGVWDTEKRTIKTVTHKFTQAMTYRVILEVTDLGGFTNTYSRNIVVTNPNTAPDADFTITPGSGTINTKFVFDASISKDQEDDIALLQVRWDWDNDDVYDTEFTTEKQVSKQFDQPGTYIVKVQVRDSGGLTDTKVRLVVVN